MSDDANMKKSAYGPPGTAAGAQYQPEANQKRKAGNTGDVVPDAGTNKNVKSYSSKPGQLSAKQQAAAENSLKRRKALSSKVKTLSREEIAQLNNDPTKAIKSEGEMLDVSPDGKREMVEGKEPLKKDPKARWNALKKALDHNKAFMNLDEAMGDDEEAQEEEQQPPVEGGQEMQPPVEGQEGEMPPEEAGQEVPPEEGQMEGDESPPEAVSAGPEEGQEERPDQENPEEGNGNLPVDPQELMEALANEGYSEQEIAYIVHGHHAPEIDESKAAKAEATRAMSNIDITNAQKSAELEHSHNEQSLAAEREHKKRMQDLEFEQAQKKHALLDQDAAHKQRMADVEHEQAQRNNPAALETAHKQRMLDLEYERAKKESEQSDGSEGDAEANRELKMLEVEKKKLELKLHQEELKLELEFKKREHELKLKMMEAQIKEQAKHKGEISGIKHEQKLKDAKNPPKKPLKKSEDDNDEGRDQ